MKVVVVGGGGRENAIALSAVSSNNSVYSISHNNNPGLIGISKKHYKINENDKEAVLNVAKKIYPDLVLIGPEDPLSNGVSDILISQKFNVFAPSSKAAKLETSKSFLREFMKYHKIDGNVESYSFTNFDDLKKLVLNLDYEFVLKPDGLTGGKGVLVQVFTLIVKRRAFHC
jgi:Phosphoribosylamine-glycine ligase